MIISGPVSTPHFKKGFPPMTYTISHVSKMMNLPVSTIRYYDKEGLLPFLQRKDSGYRMFTDSDIQMLQVIECFKSTGMPIRDIKQFVLLVKEEDSSLNQRYQLFLERKKAVEKQMEELQRQMEIINHKCVFYETAIAAGTEDIHKGRHNDCR